MVQKLGWMDTLVGEDRMKMAELCEEAEVQNKQLKHWTTIKEDMQEIVRTEAGRNRIRLPGGGRKIVSEFVERQILEWINKERANGEMLSNDGICVVARRLYHAADHHTMDCTANWVRHTHVCALWRAAVCSDKSKLCSHVPDFGNFRVKLEKNGYHRV